MTDADRGSGSAFAAFVRDLARRGDYPLPPGTLLPEPTDPIGHSAVTIEEAAIHIGLPLPAFRWAWACWQHHIKHAAGGWRQ